MKSLRHSFPLILLLSACASPPPAAVRDEDWVRQLAELEARLAGQGQSQSALLGDLARRVEALAAPEARQDGPARERVQQLSSQQEQEAVRLSALERRVEEMKAWSREAASALKVRQADVALGARIDALEQALRQTGGAVQQTDSARAQSEQRARTELATLGARLQQDDQRLSSLAEETARALGELETARRAAAKAGARDQALADRVGALEKKVSDLAAQVSDALELAGYGQRKIHGKVLHQIVLTQDKTLFPLNSSDLGDQDTSQLDALVPRLKELGTNYHLHIEGHTDGIGPEDYNYQLGKARAEVVKRYLNERWGIPLLRMSVTSHGATARAPGQPSRRIVVQVLQ